MSNIIITANQTTTETILSFTLTGQSGTTGYGNITVPKSAIPYGTTPTIYINGQQAQTQGNTQDTYNFYIWYTTHFSLLAMSIVFTTPSPSASPANGANMPQAVFYGVMVVIVVVTIIAVMLTLRKRGTKKADYGSEFG
jgi:hypothetical protein